MYTKQNLVWNSSRRYLIRIENYDTKLIIIVSVEYFVNACGAILEDSHSTRDIPMTDKSRTRYHHTQHRLAASRYDKLFRV